jgi:hypothetical protein
MPRTAITLEISHLGPSRKTAIRTLLTEFRNHGWRDIDGTALAMIDRLQANGGHATPRTIAASASTNFLVVNHVSRARLTEALDALARR